MSFNQVPEGEKAASFGEVEDRGEIHPATGPRVQGREMRMDVLSGHADAVSR